MRASCRIGALCTGYTGDQVEALSRFGEAFGMAFQIVDDVLDIVSTNRAMGKPVGNDLREGVYTLPVLYALQADHDDLLRSRLGQLINDPVSVGELLELVKANGAIEQALDMARRFNRTAAEALAGLDDGPVVAGLAKLPEAYLEWALSERTAGTYTLVG
jgi:geranylgeranyl pyrophosphate synthase